MNDTPRMPRAVAKLARDLWRDHVRQARGTLASNEGARDRDLASLMACTAERLVAKEKERRLKVCCEVNLMRSVKHDDNTDISIASMIDGWWEKRLRTRTIRVLAEHKVNTVDDLVKLTEQDILRFPDAGRKVLKLLRETLRERGLSFRI